MASAYITYFPDSVEPTESSTLEVSQYTEVFVIQMSWVTKGNLERKMEELRKWLWEVFGYKVVSMDMDPTAHLFGHEPKEDRTVSAICKVLDEENSKAPQPTITANSYTARKLIIVSCKQSKSGIQFCLGYPLTRSLLRRHRAWWCHNKAQPA